MNDNLIKVIIDNNVKHFEELVEAETRNGYAPSMESFRISYDNIGTGMKLSIILIKEEFRAMFSNRSGREESRR